MTMLLNTLRNRLFAAIVAAVIAPQLAVAGGHGGGHGGGSGGGMSRGNSFSSPAGRSVQRFSGPIKSNSAGNMAKQNSSSNFGSSTTKTQSKFPVSQAVLKNNSQFKTDKFDASKLGAATKASGIQASGKVNGMNSKVLQQYVKDAGGSTKVGGQKLSKSDLLAKYGIKDKSKVAGKDLPKKDPGNPTNPTTPTNPTNPTPTNPSNPMGGDKHKDHWVHGGFPWWGWGIPTVFGYQGGLGYQSGVCYQGDGPGYVDQVDTVYGDAPVYGGVPASASAPAPSPASDVTAPQPVSYTTADQTVSIDSVASPSPESSATGNVDLVLEDVQYIEPATLTAGPAYRVKFRNQGSEPAGKFRIGAFAELASGLSDDAPRSVVEVPSLGAGQSGEVTLRLPSSAMKLVSTSASQANAFDQLLVILDLDDAIVESEKTNNVANLERTELEAPAR